VSRRRAGVLVHPTSLPEHPGGVAGAAAAFVAWARDAGISLWQILPVNPPGHGRSPYGAQSSLAGDPSWFGDDPHADPVALDSFKQAHAAWLEDWALYAAVKDRQGGAPWLAWPETMRRRDPASLRDARRDLRDEIERHRRMQFVFFERWGAVRVRAREYGVDILGDVPIYVALDSADVWAHQDLFFLDEDGAPTRVAGVPPDYFSETGQLWGNPLYRWNRMRETGYAWWVARLAHGLELHDALRLDHFRGFSGYWSVAADATTAANGMWEPGPGMSLFDAVRGALGGLPFVAEDLGVITDDVVALRRALGLPGMRVLQFGFDHPQSDHAPHHLTRDVVVYTGTHDNDTARGWIGGLDPASRERVLAYVGCRAEEIAWGLIRVAMTSVADLAIVPLQDLLDLGSEARMNTPGIADGNWGWQAPAGALTAELAHRLHGLCEISGRLP